MTLDGYDQTIMDKNSLNNLNNIYYLFVSPNIYILIKFFIYLLLYLLNNTK